MKREQLEHHIRAAGAITGSRRLIVIGSQSILGTFPLGAPDRAYLSREADLIPIDAPEKSDVISVVLGQYSPFDQSFGYFGVCAALAAAGRVDAAVLRERPALTELDAADRDRIAARIDLHFQQGNA